MSIKDLFTLSLVNQRGSAKLSNAFIFDCIKKRIAAELIKIFGENYGKFIDTMVKARAVLSGSFILQCILDERWDNSDIDVYVADEEGDKIIQMFFGLDGEDYWSDYYGKFPHIENITNFHITPPNYHLSTVKIQVVRVKTDDKYTLRRHVKNTGFDICKNMLYFDKNKRMQIELENLNGIINKCIVFTVLDTDDFLYRIKKYSERGFFFKPKYNRLFYLEYVMLKKYRARIGINHDKTRKFEPDNCHPDCIVKLLFRNVKHYHVHGDYCNNIFIDNDSGIINGLVPCLRVGYKGDSSKFKRSMWKCKTLDDYVKLRERLSTDKSIFGPRNDLKYNIQYGLPYNGTNKHMSGAEYRTQQESRWITVGKGGKPSTAQPAKQPIYSSPINKSTTWAGHLKNIHSKKN